MRQINQKFLKAIIEATPNAIYIKDEDGKYLMINEKGAKTVGKMAKEYWQVFLRIFQSLKKQKMNYLMQG